MKLRALAFVVLLALTLSACGFHLRGSRGADLDFQSAFVKGTDIELVQRLQDTLQQSDIALADTPDAAQVVLNIEATRVLRRILTIGRAGDVSEYELRYEVDVSVQDGAGQTLQPRRTVEQVTEYSYDPTIVLAKDEEEQILIEDLREGAVRDVMRQLTKLQRKTEATN